MQCPFQSSRWCQVLKGAVRAQQTQITGKTGYRWNEPMKDNVNTAEKSPQVFFGAGERTRWGHLTLCSLQVAGDAGVFRPVQHGADLLAQFQGGGSDQSGGLSPDPDEDVGPAVQDVNTLGVQQGLQLWKK